MAYQAWNTGDTVSAAAFTYIADAVINVFATETLRDAGITSPSDGMFAYTTTTPADTLSYYNGSAWVAVDLAGDITGITTAAASGLSGGATSGTVTLTLNLAGLTAAQAFGSDGSGVDVSFHSATSGDLMLWDASEEKLVITGTNGQNSLEVADGNVTMADDLAVTGNVTIQGLDMDTIVEGDVIYGSGADTLARLAKGSDAEVLTLASGVPSWAAASGLSWSGSTANGIGTYGSSSSVVAESTATYNGTTLQLTTSGGGLKMDGLNSSDVNTLDDYEEGEFTISATCASGTITINASNNTCAYTKVGRLVTVQGETNVSAISSPSGQITIAGFPFTCTNSGTETAARSWNMGTVLNTATDVAGTPAFVIFANASVTNCFTVGTAAQDYFGNRIDTGTFIQVYGSYITDA